MFRAHFLAPSSCQEVSSAFLNRAAQSLRWLPNSTAAPCQRRATIWPEPPMCRFAATAASVACLSPQDWKTRMTCAVTLIKVRKSCAFRRPHSLARNHLNPAAGQGRDGWRRSQVQWMTMTSYVSRRVLRAPRRVAGNRLSAR